MKTTIDDSMNKKELNDIRKILQLNNSINELYNHLAELEIDGLIDSKEYKDTVDLIKFSRERCDHYLLKYSMDEEELDQFPCHIGELSPGKYFNAKCYIDISSNIKNRRLLEHRYEIDLIRHDTVTEDFEVDMEDLEKTKALYIEEDNEEYMDEIQEQEDAINWNIKALMKHDNFLYAQHLLETHTFMDYLMDEIKKTESIELKNELIKAKYRVIGIVRALENTFFEDNTMNYNIFWYQNELHKNFEKEEYYYSEYICNIENAIDEERNMLMERNKEDYKNMDEKIYDILLSILIQTKASLIPNEEVREAICIDNEAAYEISPGRKDRQVLKRSLKLNPFLCNWQKK
jgi:hypothetical protein